MRRHRAVVIGGGFAGLVAARILSDHFAKVVILERDEISGSSDARTGAPQGAHLHVLLKRGQDVLRQLFPGIERIFDAASCPRLDWAEDTRWDSMSGTFPTYSSKIKTYSFSRPFLESTIRTLVAKRPNIEFQQARVEKLVQREGRATHFQCSDTAIQGDGDLFVVCGGQNFAVNRIVGQPIDLADQHIPIQITYRSMTFATASLHFNDYRQYYYQLAPRHQRIGAVVCPVENGRTIATIVESGPPRLLKANAQEFLRLSREVPGGEFHKIIAHGFPLSKVAVYHKPTMYMRRPDKIAEFPQNVLLIGDVFCSLNPVYGQGMTAALLQTEILASQLTQPSVNAKAFHRRSASRLRLPFLLSRLGSETQGSFRTRYLDAYLARCQRSPRLHHRFLGALHLENSYPAMFDLQALGATVLNFSGHSND